MGVEETREPVRLGSALGQPRLQLLVPLQQALEPRAERPALPRPLEPLGGDLSVEEGVQGVHQVTAERHGTRDGQPQVLQRLGGEIDDDVQAVDLLPEVDGQGLGRAAGEFVERNLGAFSLEHLWNLGQKVLRDGVDNLSR